MMKRRRGNDQEPHPLAGHGLPWPLPTDEKSVESIVRHVLQQDYGLKLVDRISNERQIGVNVKYESIAPLFDLQPGAEMRDIMNFPLHRARLPTALFKSIVEDINLLLVQYGPPHEHRTEGVTSRLISPIFNRLVAEFGGSVINRPETNIKGSITTRGRIQSNFVAFGSVSILCVVEAELQIGSLDERLDAVAQVIAECEGCYNSNINRGFSVPVHCILFNGERFQFFLFEGPAPFSFKRGAIDGEESLKFRIPTARSIKSCHGFFEELRQICEITFDLFLSSYIWGLDAYHTRCVNQDKKEHKFKPITTELEKALIPARVAQVKFRDADLEHQNRDQSSATTSVTNAMKVFYSSIELIPEIYKIKSMLDPWNDKAVEAT